MMKIGLFAAFTIEGAANAAAMAPAASVAA
jgi:hypothetical protein